jgi:predicted patatin/cPLA2 family phospholipase
VARTVVDVLLERRAAGSRPGAREDPDRVALAVEGGGMRGAVHGAMMVALSDLGLLDAFDDVYALSAGALNAAYFVTGHGWEALSSYYDHLAVGREFFDPRRALRGKPVMSLDFVIDEVMTRRNPLDFQAVLTAAPRLRVIVSSVTGIRPRTISEFASTDDLRTILRATACLPLVGGPPVPYQGDLLVDGGVLLAHPVRAAIDDGATHVVALRTKPAEARGTRPGLVERFAAHRLDRLNKGLGAAFLRAQNDHHHVQAVIDSAAAGEQPCQVLDVVCPKGAHDVSRFTRDPGTLLAGIRAGYRTLVTEIEGDPGTIFLRPAARVPARVPAQAPGDGSRSTSSGSAT